MVIYLEKTWKTMLSIFIVISSWLFLFGKCHWFPLLVTMGNMGETMAHGPDGAGLFGLGLVLLSCGLGCHLLRRKGKKHQTTLVWRSGYPKSRGNPQGRQNRKWWTCIKGDFHRLNIFKICWMEKNTIVLRSLVLRKPHVAARRLSRPFWLLW